ncbi:tetratricopeptide repeat protein [Streptomyces sp. NPDC005263]|uniref:tetratricopeptide repeat protein n=1 Tax=Streptomyces sp. NPDC005263 TaxID=3364711 RepID=UPI00368B28F7
MVLTGAAALSTGMMSWALNSAMTPESEATQPAVNRPLQDADSILQAGILQQENHDLKGAARTYQRVLRLDPQNKFAWYNLGVIAHNDGRTDDAREAYEKSLKIDPAFMSALFNEGILLKSSDPDRAMGLLERALGVDPQAASVHLHLGEIWAMKNRDQVAADEFRSAVAADPSLRSQVPESFRDSVSLSPRSSTAGSTR